jgi:hypothetical protein
MLGVHVENPSRVRSFLNRHNELVIAVQIGAQQVMLAHPNLSLTLTVKDDPEVPEEWLTLIARADRYDDDSVMAVVDAVDEAIQTLISPRSGILHVTTDFRPAN